MAQIIWQADFYRRPLQDAGGQALWELLVCDLTRTIEFVALCPQSQANAQWLVKQLQLVADKLPDTIQVFRPQSLSLITAAGEKLGITVEATRRTNALKQWLQERSPLYRNMDNYTGEAYDLLALEKPPPTPLPEKLWGEQWRFAALSAKDVEEAFQERPIPILDMPPALMPLQLGLASNTSIPGVIIYGGRQSMRLARWLQEANPVTLNYIAGTPDGLVLEAGLVDRWIVATFEDQEVSASAQIYEQRKQQQSKGLHFLLVQPDNSDVTFSGFWLLRQD
ncbi:Tab2/Atab2 family RNA-binding protein [Gloeocapsopsis crepidinum LEGE 06123]|uniref:Tab2/Atab2 family RNA-binding protein n=1 Tax=Gloeocapsopsis crepidinum LEGE 06123 TaxID=588587 RepID=A0ABR9UWW7_9CHRO|nr:Tab2/Atab2 family RNA-binding protein [Gloeocapsopsis crepidinum]MBE9192810.1 Tab2/Atab2 family RNA-binding protein [Gloeocapsopsis crepidinum LEGE 06123]